MIRLVPDPVVVASTGPLPSATLHETTASSGTNAGLVRIGSAEASVNK
jgi:hypothetical protein